MTQSAKPLFRAIKGRAKARPDQAGLMPIEDSIKPKGPEARNGLDLYPTAEPDAIRALLAYDGPRLRGLGSVWEPAAGHGHLTREIEDFGLPCMSSDIVDHGGCDGLFVGSFYDWADSLAPAIITNPPYDQINARDGRGRWLAHTLSLPAWRYCAYLLSWDWPAAKANGLGELLQANPFSYCYLMRWKLDFTGGGSPPQRNAWFVWDRDDPRAWARSGGGLPEPSFRLMDRADARQGRLL